MEEIQPRLHVDKIDKITKIITPVKLVPRSMLISLAAYLASRQQRASRNIRTILVKQRN